VLPSVPLAHGPDTRSEGLGCRSRGRRCECHARDTRLNRTVAIKILPDYIAGDPEARRFEREARPLLD
jgi:hypothetical protein